MSGEPLKGAAARSWDLKALSEEQNLVQPLYDKYKGSNAFDIYEFGAKMGAGPLVDMPKFPENGCLACAEDRWRFGAGSMGYDVSGEQMP